MEIGVKVTRKPVYLLVYEFIIAVGFARIQHLIKIYPI